MSGFPPLSSSYDDLHDFRPRHLAAWENDHAHTHSAHNDAGENPKGRLGDALVLELFGASLGQEDVTIRKPEEVAPAVRAFGGRIRAEHPDASFKIIVSVRKGQRKPPGYDTAEKRGAFGDRAFMHVETEGGRAIIPPAPAQVVS